MRTVTRPTQDSVAVQLAVVEKCDCPAVLKAVTVKVASSWVCVDSALCTPRRLSPRHDTVTQLSLHSTRLVFKPIIGFFFRFNSEKKL